MRHIRVLGAGCAKCKYTAELIREVAAKLGVEVELEKVEDFKQIAMAGVLSTPGVVLDGKLMHSGGVPSREQVTTWLSASPR